MCRAVMHRTATDRQAMPGMNIVRAVTIRTVMPRTDTDRQAMDRRATPRAVMVRQVTDRAAMRRTDTIRGIRRAVTDKPDIPRADTPPKAAISKEDRFRKAVIRRAAVSPDSRSSVPPHRSGAVRRSREAVHLNSSTPPVRHSRRGRSPHERVRLHGAAHRHPPAVLPRRKRRRNHSLLGRLFKTILILVIVVFLLYSAIAMVGILQMNRVAAGERSVTSGSMEESYVKNVLVIGTDTRDPSEERGRSDSMILVSMNSRTKEITMTSFMRDVYVEIPNNGYGKLNAAYSYGGQELLMDTLEENYDISIDDYVMITFAACAKMIDAVGGVKLELSDDEAQAVNEILISEVNEIMGDDREDDLLSSGGTLTLDGKQALSYSRIRYVGNADFERTERQRMVMQQVMQKATKNPFRLASICMSALPEMTTNLSAGELYGYAVTTPLKLATSDLKQQRIPEDGTFSGVNIDGEDVLQIDFDAAKQELKDTVFASE